jgi:hypothetical protein
VRFTCGGTTPKELVPRQPCESELASEGILSSTTHLQHIPLFRSESLPSRWLQLQERTPAQRLRSLLLRLDEQASQIQKVSAQLEVSKPAPQVVVDKP